MNSHIINPFKVDTQFTLQIHLIIDLITFKETVVFGSTGMQYSFYSSLPIFIGFLQKLVLPGLGNAWRCVTSPHLSVRTPPATRLKLSHEEEPAGWFAGGKREYLHDGLHKMGPPFAETPLRWQPWAPQPGASWGNSFQPSPLPWTAGSSHVSLLQWQPRALLRKGREFLLPL